MTLNRRAILTQLCCAAIGSIGAMAGAPAQASYPAKPIRFIVPFAPGGEVDIAGRTLANALNRLKGYTVIVDNIPGAGGSIGVERGLREPPDGYAFVVISGSYTANLAMAERIQDPLGSIQPIVQFAWQPGVLVGNIKYANLADFIARAKKAPNTLNYGTSGVGSLAHFSVKDFARAADIKLTHIPYKATSQSITDLAGGQLDLVSAGVTTALSIAKANKVRILAVSSETRVAAIPEVPTTLESGVRYVAGVWHGLIAPKGTPSAIVKKINDDIAQVLHDPDTLAAFKGLSMSPVGGTPEQFAGTITKEYDRLRLIAASAGFRTEK